MFAREYQQQIFNYLDYQIYNISKNGNFLENYDIRFHIMSSHLNLTFSPYCDLSLCFLDTYFQSLLLNLASLIALPVVIIFASLEFIFTANIKLIGYIFEPIFNIALTLMILTLEIASGLLSLVTKPLITLGFLVAYTADFMMNLFRTPENAEHTNKRSDLTELDKLLLK